METDAIWQHPDMPDHLRAPVRDLGQEARTLRTLFEGGADAVFVTNEHGVVDCNQAALDMFEVGSREQMIGMHPWQLSPETQPDGRNSREASDEIVRDALAHESKRFDWMHRAIDGRPIPSEVMLTAFSVGGRTFLHAMVRDMTERLRAEEAVRASEERFRGLFDEMAQGVVYQDRRGRIIQANPAAERILGVDRDTMLGRTSADPHWHVVREDGSELSPEEHPSMLALRTGREVRDVVLGIYRPDEERYRWISVSAMPSFAPGEAEPREVFATFTDITERKEAEHALLTERNLLRTIIDHLPDQVFVKDRDSRFILHNANAIPPQLRDELPFDSTSLLGKTDFDILPRDRAERHYAEEQEIMETGVGFTDREYHVMHEPGGEDFFRSTKLPLRDESGETVGLVGINHYVTEFRQLLRAVEESEAQHRALVEQLPVGVFVHRRGRALYVNPTGLRMFGVADASQARGLQLVDRIHPDDHDRVLERTRLVEEDGQVTELDTARFIRLDGTVFPMATMGIPHSWEGETAELSIGIDVSERVQMERERAAILDGIRDEVVFTDRKGCILWANRAFAVRMGTAPEEVVGWERPERSADPSLPSPVSEAMRTGEQRVAEVRSADDTVWSVSAFPVVGDDGQLAGVVEIARDVTQQTLLAEERRRLEESAQRTQRLEAIGVLAGGIAHDFNNILSAIMGYGELAHMAAREDSVERRHLEEIIHAGARARDLVKQILTFGRQHSAEVQAANLQPIVKEAMKLLRASLPTTIEFRASIPDDCGPALVDPTQFHQAVVNLCTNAGYAMREAGGVLEVDLRECEVDAALAARLGVAGPGRFLRLTVSDTGAGMSKETLDRAFEPFFTTKPEGEGTGLGLATVHGIVTGVGGGISVYSEPGHGTTFQVYVPLAQEPAEGGTHIEDTAAGGTEYVMVVDDEPTVAAMASESLRALGYSVDVFIDSQQALGAFSDEPDRYDLVLTDQTMPNLTGDQLVASMRFLRPDLPAVIATGFQPRIEQGLLSHSASPKVLSKPFSVGDLARAVRGALDEARQ